VKKTEKERQQEWRRVFENLASKIEETKPRSVPVSKSQVKRVCVQSGQRLRDLENAPETWGNNLARIAAGLRPRRK